MDDAAPIRYKIWPADPFAHEFEVTCRVAEPNAAGQRFRLPGWVPGSYLVRDYARLVVAIAARSESGEVGLRKIDKATWLADPCEGPLEVTCRVYAFDLSVRGAYLDTRRAFFNGVCVFLEVDGSTGRPCEVEVLPPKYEVEGRWRVATSMRATGTDEHGFGTYRAADYDELIDHPFEISDFVAGRFMVGDKPHEIVLAGRQFADVGRLCADVARLCETHVRLFGEPLPFDYYVFLVNVVGEGYGGLEHRASSALITRRDDLPAAGLEAVDKSYRRFLGLVSHEYFHLWNVKRIMPAAFIPFRLEKESHTTLLWVFEGITSYYDDLALVRSGLITPQAYLELLGEMISRVWQTPGRGRQSLAESSYDAWIKLYKPDENSPNAGISYYSKGSLVALALDLTIRRRTSGAKSLDDVMRALWLRHGKTGHGVEEDGFEKLAGEVTGLELGEFFDAAVRGTDDPPLAGLLADVGVEFLLEPIAEGPGEAAPAGQAEPRCALGVRLREENGRAVLVNVFSGGPAERAGLAPGDELVAMDDLKVTASSYRMLLNQFRDGQTIEIRAFRRDELVTRSVKLQSAPPLKCKLTLDEDAESSRTAARISWLHLGNQSA